MECVPIYHITLGSKQHVYGDLASAQVWLGVIIDHDTNVSSQ
jgi:hypothetical protein